MATGEKFSETEMDDMSKNAGDEVDKAKDDAAEAKEKIDGTTSKEEQERILDELQEKQRQSFFNMMDTFLSDKIFGGGKRSTKIVKLRELYKLDIKTVLDPKDLNTINVNDPSIKKIHDKLTGRLKGLEKNGDDPMYIYASFFPEGSSVIDPKTRTWKEFVKLKREGSVDNSSFGELIDAQVKYLDTLPEYKGILDMHNKVKEMNKQMAQATMDTVSNGLRKDINGVADDLQQTLKEGGEEALKKKCREQATTIVEKEGKGASGWDYFYKFLYLLGILGLVWVGYGVVALICGCHQQQLNSGCTVIDPTSEKPYGVKLTTKAANMCQFTCAGSNSKIKGCVDCCGGCGFGGINIGAVDSTTIKNKCCNNDLDVDGKNRKDWQYQYDCISSLEGLGYEIKHGAENLADLLGDFFKKLGPYLPYIIGIIIAIILVPMMIRMFKN